MNDEIIYKINKILTDIKYIKLENSILRIKDINFEDKNNNN